MKISIVEFIVPLLILFPDYSHLSSLSVIINICQILLSASHEYITCRIVLKIEDMRNLNIRIHTTLWNDAVQEQS